MLKRHRFLSATLSVTAIGLFILLVGADTAEVRTTLMGIQAFSANQDHTGAATLSRWAACAAIW